MMPVMWLISVVTVIGLLLRLSWVRKLVGRAPLPYTGFYHQGSPHAFWYRLQWFQPQRGEGLIEAKLRDLKIQALAEPPILVAVYGEHGLGPPKSQGPGNAARSLARLGLWLWA